jgi:cytochrome b6-f complex iron-sulfur subunit
MEEHHETLENQKTEPNENTSILQSRRQFLRVFVGLAGAAGAIEFTYPLLKFFTPVQRGEVEPVVVSLEEVPIGGAKSILYGGSPVLVLNFGEKIVAVSLVCTHLGCIAKWDDQGKQFQCPCHEGFFDWTGKVISGPPPEPLEPLTVRIAGDKLIVGAV